MKTARRSEMNQYIHKVNYYETDKIEIRGETVLLGKSKHCFVDKANRPIILKRQFPELDAKLKELSEVK